MPALAVDLRSVVTFVDRYPVLAGVDFQVEAGTCVLLKGPNGAGKTSLLRVLAGLTAISSGSARVLDWDLSRDVGDVRRQVGFVGHSSFLYGELTVRENLDFCVKAADVDTSAVASTCAELGLTARLKDVIVDRLSAGQRRRVALAAMVVRQPSLMLLDEPLTSLDSDARQALARLVTTAKTEGRTVIFSSHENDHGDIPVDRRVDVVGGEVHGLLSGAVSGVA